MAVTVVGPDPAGSYSRSCNGTSTTFTSIDTACVACNIIFGEQIGARCPTNEDAIECCKSVK